MFPRDVDILLRLGADSVLAQGGVVRRRDPFDPYLQQLVCSRPDGSICASRVDRTGVLRYSLANQVRLDYWDLDGDGVFETVTIAVEAGRTNGWTKSEKLDDAAYTQSLVTVSPNATIAPDGLLTADKIAETAVSGTHFLARTTPTLTDNKRQSFSTFLKAAERTWGIMEFFRKDGSNAYAYFNLATGQLGTTQNIVGAGMRRLANGWFHCHVCADCLSGASAPAGRIYTALGDGQSNFLGVAGSGIYAWGSMWETDICPPSSYIPTDTVAVSRAAEKIITRVPFPPRSLWMYSKLLYMGDHYIPASPAAFPEHLSIGAYSSSTWRLLSPFWNGPAGKFANSVGGAAPQGQTDLSAGVAPSIYQLVEHLSLFDKENRTSRFIQSIAGGAEGLVSSGVQAFTYPATWGGDVATMLQVGGENQGAPAAETVVRLVRAAIGAGVDVQLVEARAV